MPFFTELSSAAQVGDCKTATTLDKEGGISGELRRDTCTEAAVAVKDGWQRMDAAVVFESKKGHWDCCPIFRVVANLFHSN